MNKLLKSTTLGAALVAAILPLACCWGPTLLAGVALLSGAATKMAWLHPYEPWLYGFSFVTLGYSHFKAHKEKKDEDLSCQCATTEDNSTQQAKQYANIALWAATVLVIIMFVFNQFPEWFVW